MFKHPDFKGYYFLIEKVCDRTGRVLYGFDYSEGGINTQYTCRFSDKLAAVCELIGHVRYYHGTPRQFICHWLDLV